MRNLAECQALYASLLASVGELSASVERDNREAKADVEEAKQVRKRNAEDKAKQAEEEENKQKEAAKEEKKKKREEEKKERDRLLKEAQNLAERTGQKLLENVDDLAGWIRDARRVEKTILRGDSTLSKLTLEKLGKTAAKTTLKKAGEAIIKIIPGIDIAFEAWDLTGELQGWGAAKGIIDDLPTQYWSEKDSRGVLTRKAVRGLSEQIATHMKAAMERVYFSDQGGDVARAWAEEIAWMMDLFRRSTEKTPEEGGDKLANYSNKFFEGTNGFRKRKAKLRK